MPREICEASQNITKNLYAIAYDSGRGITDIERAADCNSGLCSMELKRGSSYRLNTALRLAKAVNVNLMDLMKDPKQFREEFL